MRFAADELVHPVLGGAPRPRRNNSTTAHEVFEARARRNTGRGAQIADLARAARQSADVSAVGCAAAGDRTFTAMMIALIVIGPLPFVDAAAARHDRGRAAGQRFMCVLIVTEDHD